MDEDLLLKMDSAFTGESFLSQMEIHYVYDLKLDTNDPILRKIFEFCNSNDIPVKCREFNTTLEEDADFVTHLPAIQIYKRSKYQDTIYPDFKPIQFLRAEFDKFELEEFEKESKKQIWEERISHLRNMFKSLKTDFSGSKSNR